MSMTLAAACLTLTWLFVWCGSDIQDESDRNQALVIGLASFFRFIGMSPQKSTSLERTSSFMAKDKRAFMRMPKSGKKVRVC